MKTVKLLRYPFGLIFSLILLTGFICACSKDEVENRQKPPVYFEANEYNTDLNDFSIAVSNALRSNHEFRKVIKDEALLMIDGDYDVLLKRILDRKVSPSESSLKSGMSNYSVKDLLNDSHPGKSKGLKTTASLIETLSADYPYLQIAVPVNAEQWNEASYIPTVTFLPAEYDDGITKSLIGYDSYGRLVEVDVINEPSDPVIVIGENERMYLQSEPGDAVMPATPSNLTGVQTESGIRLCWTMPAGTSAFNTTGFYVYRKSTSETDYIKIYSVNGAYTRSYDDNAIEASRSYSYYIMSHNQGVTSEPSNYITMTAPNYPKPVLSFDAIQNSGNEVELRWQNDHSQYILETRLYRHIVGVTGTYQILRSFTPNQQGYFDTNIEPGRKIIYKVNHVTSVGESNAKYDFIQVPYRDISKKSPVFIKKINFADWTIERWVAGKPEFYITVTNVDAEKKTPYIVQDEIICNFSDRSSTSQTFYGKKVLDWQPGYWFDMLSFYALEYDRSLGKLTVNASVGYNKKNIAKTGLDTSAGIDYAVTFSDKGEKCGNSYLNYFDVPMQWIVFPNYGVKILISDNDL